MVTKHAPLSRSKIGGPEFTDPEILRTNLASVILQMAALDLGDMADFPFVEPPESRNIADGVRLLEELGAFSPGHTPGRGRTRLTETGRKLSRLPLDPRLGRMILRGRPERLRPRSADHHGGAVHRRPAGAADGRARRRPTRCTPGSQSRARTSWPS